MNELWEVLRTFLWTGMRSGPERGSLYIFDVTHLKKKKKTNIAGSQSVRNEAGETHEALVFQSVQHLWETITPPFLVLEI